MEKGKRINWRALMVWRYSPSALACSSEILCQTVAWPSGVMNTTSSFTLSTGWMRTRKVICSPNWLAGSKGVITGSV